MRAMILAAGLGTRLRPITDTLPKALVPVAGVPNIVRLINHLKRAGINEIVINTHHLGDVLIETLGDGSSWGVAIEYSCEEELLGTGGGIKRALPLLGDETFIVVNGDALFTPNISDALDAHRRSGALATLLVREDPRAEAYGAVGLDRDSRVCYLVWAGELDKAVCQCIFTGFHIIEPELGEQLPKSGCIVRLTYIPALEQGAPLYGLKTETPFFDLGTPRRYLDANMALVMGNACIDGFDAPETGIYLGRGVVLGEGSEIGPGTVVGDDVRVGDGVRLERAVILSHAEVNQDVFEGIVSLDSYLIDAS